MFKKTVLIFGVLAIIFFLGLWIFGYPLEETNGSCKIPTPFISENMYFNETVEYSLTCPKCKTELKIFVDVLWRESKEEDADSLHKPSLYDSIKEAHEEAMRDTTIFYGTDSDTDEIPLKNIHY